MGDIIRTIEGNNGRTYNIIKGKDGVIYCTCPAWKFSNPHNCKHLDNYYLCKLLNTRSDHGQTIKAIKTSTEVIKSYVGGDDALVESIEKGVW